MLNQPQKLLIIDDEGDICFLLNIILKGEKIDLEHVNTLSQAKVFLREETPSLVFLDNSLPDGKGVEFINYIKLNYPAVKIVMITGYNAATEKEKALKNGADMFLEKPFTKQQVWNTVQELLNAEEQAS